MPSQASVPRSVAEIVDLFVASRLSKHIVSTGDAIRSIRYLVPACEHTDRELADLVALCAMRRRCDVAFDHVPSSAEVPLWAERGLPEESRFATNSR